MLSGLDFRPDAVALDATSVFVAGEGSSTATLRVVRLGADGGETLRAEAILP
ncbi:MAG: hypothetical protein KIT84_04880 [Labilithrix sp.]|nr:hypothetical protein [Labilithrix sp.]MCW5810321.1 hypothetical protein [Labilithrix sp.]